MIDGGGRELLPGLPPILDAEVRTLILGSFPSPASLAAGQYYGHPRNQFWRLVGALIGEPLGGLEYALRQQRLLRHHLGVWDVYCRCRRQGALDAAIRLAEVNEFARLRHDAPQLARVCFNGQTAGKFAPWFKQNAYQTVVLPSSSPAYTLSFESKLALWRAAGVGGVENALETPHPESGGDRS